MLNLCFCHSQLKLKIVSPIRFIMQQILQIAAITKPFVHKICLKYVFFVKV